MAPNGVSQPWIVGFLSRLAFVGASIYLAIQALWLFAGVVAGVLIVFWASDLSIGERLLLSVGTIAVFFVVSIVVDWLMLPIIGIARGLSWLLKGR